MERCLCCNHLLGPDRESLGARCPHCRQPLYEPLGRMARAAREGEARCAAHEGMEGVGDCARCRSPMCETCRTMWRGQLCCAACVDRALRSPDEATPEQERAHARQAQAALVLGSAAWLVAAVLVLALRPLAARAGPATGPVLAFVGLAVLAANVLLAAVAAGQAVAALRGRGNRRPVAVAGLVLGGLYAGAVIGVGLAYLWQS